MNVRVLLWLVALPLAARAAPLLSIDFNCRTNSGSAQMQPGFSSFLITSNVSASTLQTNETLRTVGTNRVHVWGNGLNKGYGDLFRWLPTNQGAFSDGQLLRDCVYSPDTTTNGGLNVQIDNLSGSNRFLVTVWSFNEDSAPIRASDWYANKVLVRRGYQFTNSVLPVRNDQYRFSFTAFTDAAGQLLIEGRRNPVSTNANGAIFPVPGVYLNALQIDPEPLEIMNIATNASELRITFVVRPQPPGGYVIEETSGGAWNTFSGVSYSSPTNNRVTARFPRPSQPRLYRIRYNY
ncbi:MAG TPA: hypothetical protein VK850_04970 [Candidatus Binatia bacterium]|nr:hypothetical protein [Candidatus Binatia bacterium]